MEIYSIKSLILAHGIHGGEAHDAGVVMTGAVVWRGAAEGDVAVIYQNLLQCPVLVYHIAAIVCCTARTAIGHVELLTRCIVGVADGAARNNDLTLILFIFFYIT